MNVVERRCDYPIQTHGEGTVCGERVPHDMATQFAVAANSYNADLCVNHQHDLAAVLSPFMKIAQPGRAIISLNTRGRKVFHLKDGSGFTAKDVRIWATAKGIEVAVGGRLPDGLLAAYAKAHGDN